ncbi:LysR substrate-binding domain-containing protein [Nonomuraea jiangxiensis]|uniref:DNA-binding transcriptional regulator, LysR family n=1 Tax=Nonomuraea jiangxiensis TaxID=633440 RepID=A0A1G8QIX6_9ACTN|nr:LysR substrate-binding domain-containing protein [Nonomuraea jiangxiensis]SDJ04543.1 DNA-binding transcriptional regulator, LysR family [Nonomuraea jiangxiensis]
MSFDLRHLEGFVAVAEELHFGRAAERLHLAQPALSQQILRLEASLGVDLLIRERRRTRLSDAGKAFLVEARRTLAHAAQARAVAVRAGRGELGSLRVGYVSTTSSAPFLAALAAFQRTHPDVQVELRELPLGSLAGPLRDDVVDVAFIARLGPLDVCLDEGAVLCELSAERFVAAVSADHPLAARPAVEVGELAEEAFVLLAPDICQEWDDAVHGICATGGFTPRVSHYVRELSTQLIIVAAGLAVALVPASARAMRADGVAFVPLEGAGPSITSAVLWRAGNESPVLREFVEGLGVGSAAAHASTAGQDSRG